MSAQTTQVNQSHETGHKPPAAKPAAKGPAAQTQPTNLSSLQRAMVDPLQARPADILALQRMVGNRAASRLIQTKLTVGPAGDRYEQEADRVATQVMTMPVPAPAQTQPPVQRAAEEEELQMKPLALRVQCAEEDEEKLQTQPDLQRASSGAGFEVSGDFEQQLSASRGGGYPLPASVRQFMEPRFGADFSGVRVHAGGEAAQLNRAVSAQAFTHGQDIFLGEGETDLASNDGQKLLAHELTHTLQQGSVVRRNGRKKRKISETALNRLKYASNAIKHTKSVFTKGAGNQLEVLKKTHFNSNFRVRAMRNSSYWTLTEDVKPIAARNLEALVAAKADILHGGNCGEYSAVAFNYLRAEAIGETLNRSNVAGLDHVFVLIGKTTDPDQDLVVADAWPTKAEAVTWDDYFAYEADRTKVQVQSRVVADGQNEKDVIAAGLTLSQEGKEMAEKKYSKKETKEKIGEELEKKKQGQESWIWNLPYAGKEGKGYKYQKK